MATFTNSHIHIFSGQYAPDYYLRVALPGWLDWSAPYVKTFLEGKGGRFITLMVSKLFGEKKRRLMQRYIEFIRIGTSASQEEVLQKVMQTYNHLGNVRFIPLSLNMDHMDVETRSYHSQIDSQLKDLERLKGIYPDALYPFVSVDPRHTVRDHLVWLKHYLRPDGAFYGIKLYPSKGFFPFDPRLDSVYAWAEENEIPIMTHCTRSGSFYIGKLPKQVFPNPPSLNPSAPEMASIYKRIQCVIDDKKVHKHNDQWCNIYTHPESYMPVLRKYPKLKLCFAHLGGINEVNPFSGYSVKDYLGPNWYSLLKTLLTDPAYPNIYADISYTLSDSKALQIIQSQVATDRLLYGTDFYMTEQEETHEPGLLTNFNKIFGNPIDQQKMAYSNPVTYLKSKIKPVIPL